MYRVLIVDDEPAVFEGLNLMIEWEKYGFKQPSCAHDYEEALNKFEEDKFHLVITDIRMPGMNGLDLVKEIRKISPDIAILIISGYDKFNYAKEAMKYGAKDYLLKPVDRHELANCLSNLKNELDKNRIEKSREWKSKINDKKRFLYDLVSGNLTAQDIRQNAVEYDLAINKSDYCVALCEMQDISNRHTNTIEARNDRNIIMDSIEEAFLNRKSGYVYEDNDGLIGLLLVADQNQLNNETIEQCLADIQSLIEKKIDIKLLIGFGSIENDIEKLKNSRKKAVIALNRRYISKDYDLISYDKIILGENLLLYINWNVYTFIDLLLSYNVASIKNEIANLIKELSARDLPFERISNILFNVVFILSDTIRRNGGNPDLYLKYSEINELLDDNFTLEKFDKWLSVISLKIADYLKILIEDRRRFKEINQIVKYIDDNFMNELSIKNISKKFYMNSAYLGQLFKKAIGESFSDYINRKKIAEVKRLLSTSNTLVHEVIKLVGYNNQGYFYRKFNEW